MIEVDRAKPRARNETRSIARHVGCRRADPGASRWQLDGGVAASVPVIRRRSGDATLAPSWSERM